MTSEELLPIASLKINEITDICDYYLNETFADLKFLVADKVLSAHKIILATRCKYFRRVLFENTQQNEIAIVDVDLGVFQAVLKYIYTGKLDVYASDGAFTLKVLQLARKYSLNKLEKSVTEIVAIVLNSSNVVDFFNYANSENLNDLKYICYKYLDINISKDFCVTKFSQKSMVDMLQRRGFEMPEIDQFKLIASWLKENRDEGDLVKNFIQLDKLTAEEITNIVRPTRLFDDEYLFNIIGWVLVPSASNGTKKSESTTVETAGNIASLQNGTRVISSGHTSDILLSSNADEATILSMFSKTRSSTVVVDLGRISCFNHIQFKILAPTNRYYVQVSKDYKTIQKIVDHTDYPCRSFQHLFFVDQTARYIRIVGTFEPMRIARLAVFKKETIPRLHFGYVMPNKNVATEEMGATVQQRRTNDGFLLEDMDFKSNWVIKVGHFAEITLGQPYVLSKLKFLTNCPLQDLRCVRVDIFHNQRWLPCPNPLYWLPENIHTIDLIKYATVIVKIENTDASTDLECYGVECF